jgi:hypothetical protein
MGFIEWLHGAGNWFNDNIIRPTSQGIEFLGKNIVQPVINAFKGAGGPVGEIAEIADKVAGGVTGMAGTLGRNEGIKGEDFSRTVSGVVDGAKLYMTKGGSSLIPKGKKAKVGKKRRMSGAPVASTNATAMKGKRVKGKSMFSDRQLQEMMDGGLKRRRIY